VIPNFSDIPRGDTCPNVNRTIIEYLTSSSIDFRGKTALDIPCGNGDFLDALKTFFPETRTIGADKAEPDDFAHQFRQFDARESGTLRNLEKCDLITCISGVMEFDNTLGFFRTLRQIASENALLFVTNDNLLTVRDRSLYFLFGRFGQYKTVPEKRGSTWKILHLADLERILSESGFTVREVRYVVGSWTSWLWLPLTLPVYAAQLFYFILFEKEISFTKKQNYFPFISLLARHYLFVCERDSAMEDAVETFKVSGNK
jgi:hypothetical protein